MSDYALQMRQISKTYGEVHANSGIDLSVKKGTIHAIAGENGAGKSTLMKILFGLTPHDENKNSGIFVNNVRVQFRSALDAIHSGLGMVQQHFALVPTLSALDNIILGSEIKKNGILLDRESAKFKLDKLAKSGLGLNWLEITEELPIGLQQRIEILKLLFRNADILILDEPTAVLTPSEVDSFFALLKKLRSEGKTIIIITHKLKEILNHADEVTVLRQGKLSGHFECKGLTESVLIHSMIGRNPKALAKKSTTPGKNILSVRHLSAAKSTSDRVEKISFDINENEIVGIAGVSGNGQQSLIEAIAGLLHRDGELLFRGETIPALDPIAVRRKFNIGLISEDRHHQSLWLEESITRNLTLGLFDRVSQFGFFSQKKSLELTEKSLQYYDVKTSGYDAPAKSLSGGNQQKIVIGRELSARNPDLLLACEPTRGVDIGAIELIHEQLEKAKYARKGILVVSSDLDELCALSDRILVLFEGRIVSELQSHEFDPYKIGKAMTGGQS